MRAKFAILFMLPLSLASAETLIDYQSASFFQQTADGKPATCGLEFVTIHRDLLNNGENPIGISGSLSWNASPGKFFSLLKIKGFDFPTKSADNKVPFRPSSISLFIGAGPEALKPNGQFSGEDNSLLAGYSPEEALVAFLAVNRAEKTTIGYNRKAGFYDVSIPIDFKQKLDETSWERFLSCMEGLVRNARLP